MLIGSFDCPGGKLCLVVLNAELFHHFDDGIERNSFDAADMVAQRSRHAVLELIVRTQYAGLENVFGSHFISTARAYR